QALLSRHNITAADFRDDEVLHRAMTYKQQGKSFAEIRKEMLAEIFVATTLHEVGHTIGLRHNFAGSADPLNYFTDPQNPDRDYWQLRKAEAATMTPGGRLANNPDRKKSLVPRYFYTGTAAEDEALDAARRRNLEKGMSELQYSSIMDYGHKINGDWHGLGKYDVAAVRFGYADLVEAWDFQAPDGTANKLYPNELHYSTIPEVLKPDSRNLDEQVAHVTRRKVVRASDIKDPDDEVPYRFCSDEYAGATGWCHLFDSGGDMWESVDSNMREYESYYWFYNFKRGRAKFGLDLWSYLGRIYFRHFDFLATQFKQMTNEEFFIRGDQSCTSTRFEESYPHYAGTDCGADQYLSAVESLNFFGRVLARPDVGTYGFNPASGAYELNHDSTAGGTVPKDEVRLGVGEGRYADTYFNYERYGYDFYYKPVVIGSWWDKWLAVDALGNPDTWFIQNKATDSLQYVFNYRVIFPNVVNNMVGAYITEALPRYAPAIAPDKSLLYRTVEPWSEAYTELPANSRPLNPAEQYTGRLVAAFDGLMYFTDNYDQDFTNSLKIFIKGMGEGQLPPNAEHVEVTDPVSNRTYVAIKYQPLQIKYDRRGRPVRDEAGNIVYEPVPDFLPIGYEFLTRLKSRYQFAPDDLHYELSFADIIRDAVHLYEYRQ
ncbi:MAG: zinc-dependent metalloprotease, partial [Myxococcales bacterium]